jgi:hypothetical protein
MRSAVRMPPNEATQLTSAGRCALGLRCPELASLAGRLSRLAAGLGGLPWLVRGAQLSADPLGGVV